MPKRSDTQNKNGWMALGAIGLGVILTLVGIFLLSWSSEATDRSLAQTAATATWTVAPTALFTPSPVPSSTPVPPTSTPTPVQPAPTFTPAMAVQPTSTIPADGLFQLTIVHSNDTWGYTRPCG